MSGTFGTESYAKEELVAIVSSLIPKSISDHAKFITKSLKKPFSLSFSNINSFPKISLAALSASFTALYKNDGSSLIAFAHDFK